MLGSTAVGMPHGVIAVVTGVVVVLGVLIHYEGLAFLSRALSHLPCRPRPRIIGLILALLALHGLEILLFGTAYYACVQWEALGRIVVVDLDTTMTSLLDFAYFSAVVYTTVGFGDIIPKGPVSGLAGAEAVTGLTLITWSASFTFLEMQQYWGNGNRPG